MALAAFTRSSPAAGDGHSGFNGVSIISGNRVSKDCLSEEEAPLKASRSLGTTFAVGPHRRLSNRVQSYILEGRRRPLSCLNR